MNATHTPRPPVYLVNPQQNRASQGDVRDAERELKTRFPDGYAEFVTSLGQGLLCGFVRVYLPKRILDEVAEFRSRVQEYFCWEEGAAVLPKSRVVESICIADTINGDEVIFHPDDPARLYLLPHDSETIFQIGSSLDAALDWILESGELMDRPASRYFDSGIGGQRIEFAVIKKRPSFARLKTALLKLGLHDHLHEVSGRRSKSLTLFIKAIGGSVSCRGPGRAYTLSVWHAGVGPNETLARLLEELEKLGFVPPRDPQGNLHPAIDRLKNEFFKFEGIVPCPIPPADRQPRDVVLAVIRAMNAWESTLLRWCDEGFPCEVGHATIRDIYGDLFVSSLDGDDGCFSRPPEYDPEREQIVEEQVLLPDEVQIRTQLNDHFGCERLFTIRREQGVWRAADVLKTTPPYGQRKG
jgi:hypothetical protein